MHCRGVCSTSLAASTLNVSVLEVAVPQRDRVFAFRDFVVRTFEGELQNGPVLDMAGGLRGRASGCKVCFIAIIL